MKYKITALRDSAFACYPIPQFVVSKGMSVRAFGDEIQREDAQNQLFKHPEDFDLYYLGEYDDATGVFESSLPEKIASGIDFKR